MLAKSELMKRIQYLAGALNLQPVIDIGIAQSDHNGIANLLRKGLGIVAFNMLEDFIKKKALEALDNLSSCGVKFANLTPEMQEASVFNALSALEARHTMIKRVESSADRMLLIQQEAAKISSTSNFPFQLSGLSFVSSGSNVGFNEVKDMIAAFGIKKGWSALQDISTKIGGGIPDLAQAYQNAALRRNRAAHAAGFLYDYASLNGFKPEIMAIAASLDILLTARCRQVEKKPNESMLSHDISKALNYRFLEPRGKLFIETKVIGGKVVKKWSKLDDGINYIQPRLKRKSEFLIILNSSRRIEDWFTQ